MLALNSLAKCLGVLVGLFQYHKESYGSVVDEK